MKALIVLALTGSLAAAPVPILIDSFSTNSFTGTSSAAGTDISITNTSILNFEDQSSAGDASISLDATSALNFQQTSSSTYSGLLSGNGTVTKSGSGTLSMTGNNSAFTGPLYLQIGTLYLIGNYGGDVFVSPSTTLLYGGTVSGNLDVNGGVITTGGVSTLNVMGNYTQAAGATYLANLSSTGQSTLINIAGSATIDGNVQLDLTQGVLFNHTYTLLHANLGVTGTYTLVGSYPTLGLFLTYDADNVYLSFAQNFQYAAVTPNERKVSEQLDSLTSPTADESQVLAALSTLSVAQTREALNVMSGEQLANFILVALYGDSQFTNRIYNASRDALNPCLDPCARVYTWVSGGGGHGSQSGDEARPGFNLSHSDVAAGLHGCVTPSFTLGGAIGYEADEIKFNLAGTSYMNSAQIGLYSAYHNQTLYVLSDLMAARSWAQFKRPIVFGSIDRNAHSKPQIDQGKLDIEMGFNFGNCHYRFQPFIAGGVEAYHQKKISERGAQSLDLSVEAISKWLGSNLLGFHLNIDRLDYCKANLNLAWKHYYGNLAMGSTTRFESFGSAFAIQGAKRGRNGGIGSFTLSFPWKKFFEPYVSANGEIWEKWHAYEFNGGVNIKW